MLVEFRHVFRAWDGKVALRVQGAKQEKVQGEQKMPSELLASKFHGGPGGPVTGAERPFRS